MSGNYAQNLAIAQKLSCYNAQVFCHAKREGLALYVEMSYPANRLHLVDSSYLATKALKLRNDLYPVHLVDVATDREGNRLAYVKSPFHALICGFGESGQGALSFLYEFAAFPARDKSQSPFLCDVLDRSIEQKEGRYMSSHPGMDRSRINFISGEFGTTEFWNNLRERIASLNYIFISLGSDRLNVQAALDLLAFAYQYRPNLDKLFILAKTDHPSAYCEMVDYYNENYGGAHCVHLVGDIRSTWTWDNISGNSFRRYAKVFYTAYAESSGDPTTWEEREARIMAKSSESDLSRKQEVLRKNGQDQTNYFHMRVKDALMPRWLWEDPAIAAGIPVNADDGKHYLGNNPLAGTILDYLAVGEHLRWTASHEAAGYRRAADRREDMKTHPDIRPYTELTELVKHYDWVVVKTTLELLGKEQGKA